MKQYKMNKFLLSLLVLALTSVSALLVYYFLEVEFYEYVYIGILGILGLISVNTSLMIALLLAFFITLAYGVVVILSGTTDLLNEIGISYLYLLLPTTVGIIGGMVSLLNTKYLRVADSFEEDYEALVRIDELTGFRNKTEYIANLSEEIHRKVRYKQSLSVMLLQIDSFNDLNDLYGYTQGDKFLKYLSEFMIELTRNVDKHYRISDNLFALILPNTDEEGAEILKQRFTKEFESMNIVVRTNNQVIDIDIDIVHDEYQNEEMSSYDYHKIIVDQLALKPGGHNE